MGIKEVIIAAPQITYELGGGGSNIQTIQNNVQAFAKSMGAGGGGQKPGTAARMGARFKNDKRWSREQPPVWRLGSKTTSGRRPSWLSRLN